MERLPYGKYTKEFRQEAVKLVVEGGLSIPEVGTAVIGVFHDQRQPGRGV
jgi:hypothetical protein